MTTGSLCLTEILKSWKSCSSKRPASQTADSTRASAVALPYFSSRRGSSEPALTPIRIETPASLAACAICLTWSSNLRMLPGLTRTAAQPASMAAKTYLGWKWMSAITGICECCAISGSASASSCEGHATRTMSQPVAVSSAICWRVALTSDVSVVVIDCTETGDSLPSPALPTLSWRVGRRGASTGGGAAGMPRLISVMASGYWWPAPDRGSVRSLPAGRLPQRGHLVLADRVGDVPGPARRGADVHVALGEDRLEPVRPDRAHRDDGRAPTLDVLTQPPQPSGPGGVDVVLEPQAEHLVRIRIGAPGEDQRLGRL